MSQDNTIHYIGDMFTTTLSAVGHGVNCKGVMGSGIAKLIAQKYPNILQPYREALRTGELSVGKMFPVQVTPELQVFNLASQFETGRNAKYEWVEASVKDSLEYCVRNNIKGFALPRIASDIGGLQWTKVAPLIAEIAEDYPNIIVELWSLPNADK